MVAAALVQAALDAVQRVTAAGATHDDGDDLAPAVSVPSADELIPGVADSRHFSRRSFRGRSPFSVSAWQCLILQTYDGARTRCFEAFSRVAG